MDESLRRSLREFAVVLGWETYLVYLELLGGIGSVVWRASLPEETVKEWKTVPEVAVWVFALAFAVSAFRAFHRVRVHRDNVGREVAAITSPTERIRSLVVRGNQVRQALFEMSNTEWESRLAMVRQFALDALDAVRANYPDMAARYPPLRIPVGDDVWERVGFLRRDHDARLDFLDTLLPENA